MYAAANNPAQAENTGTVELQNIQPNLHLNDKNYLKWVADSGATDHITHSSTEFISYRPCPNNKKLQLQMTHLLVCGKGDILLSQYLILKDILHVPKLSVKLLAIHKLTTDLQCLVTFSPTLRKFQDQGMGEMIRYAREENGLYLLEEARGTCSNKSQLPLSLLSESPPSHNKDI